MATLRLANAPCSWGTLEFERSKGEQIGLPACWTNSPKRATPAPSWAIGATCPPTRPCLRAELARRGLVDAGAFVPVALKDAAAHAAGVSNAAQDGAVAGRRRTEPAPYLVLADNNGTVPERTRNAGRITAGAWA